MGRQRFQRCSKDATSDPVSLLRDRNEQRRAPTNHDESKIELERADSSEKHGAATFDERAGDIKVERANITGEQVIGLSHDAVEYCRKNPAHVSGCDIYYEIKEFAPEQADYESSLPREDMEPLLGSVDDSGEYEIASTLIYGADELSSNSAAEIESTYYDASETSLKVATKQKVPSRIIQETDELGAESSDDMESIYYEACESQSGSTIEQGTPPIIIQGASEVNSKNAGEIDLTYHEAAETISKCTTEQRTHSDIDREASGVNSESAIDEIPIYQAGNTNFESADSEIIQRLPSMKDDVIDIISIGSEEADEISSENPDDASEYRNSSIDEADDVSSQGTEDASEYRDTSIEEADQTDLEETDGMTVSRRASALSCRPAY